MHPALEKDPETDDSYGYQFRPTTAECFVIQSPLISKDNKYALCCSGCDIKVLSVKSGETVHILRGHTDFITSIVFNPLNQYQVLSSSLDGTIRRWNFDDGVLIKTIQPEGAGGAPICVYGMHMIPSEPKSLLYVIKTWISSNNHTGGYRIMKQSSELHRWSPDDFITSNPMENLPRHVSVGGKGQFVAVQTDSQIFSVFDLNKIGKVYDHQVEKQANQIEVHQCLTDITCLTAHPLQHCVAVGHFDGKINIWSNVVGKKSICTWVHWHALPVLSLCYTPEGSYLLSGGHESVLTKWSHESYGDKSKREYLPRLGAPVSGIVISSDNSTYLTTHLDNSMKVIKNWLVVQVYQGLAQDYLTGMSYQFRAGIKFEPKTGSLVTNGLPGHLQFYSLYEDKLLYNLDIVGQNYTSGENLEGRKHCYTEIELLEFSHDGSWMVTVEGWKGVYSQKCRMKLWYYDTESKSYTLNTDVDTPHRGPVSAVVFAPPSYTDDGRPLQTMLVTVGAEDNKFKLWKLNHKGNINEKSRSLSWGVDSTGYFKDKPCISADFSDDGSVLAVAFSNTLTLWDPAESHMIASITQSSDILSLKFCTGQQSNLVVLCTMTTVIAWDLITYTEHRRWNIERVVKLAVDPNSSLVAVFTNAEGYVLSCTDKERYQLQFDLPNFARSITSVAYSHHPTQSSGDISDRLYLYVSTKSGSILILDDKKKTKEMATPTAEEKSKTRIASNYEITTPLATLLSSQANRGRDENNLGQIDQHTGLAAAAIIKQIGDTSCVAMPSINTLCSAFLTSLLLDKNTLREEVRGDVESSEDEDMEVDENTSDMSGDEQKTKKHNLTSENPVSEAHKRIKKLKRSDILDFKNWLCETKFTVR